MPWSAFWLPAPAATSAPRSCRCCSRPATRCGRSTASSSAASCCPSTSSSSASKPTAGGSSSAYFEGVDHVIDLVAISNDPSGELFQDATYQINHESRVHCAKLAKAAGVKRYVLPSSCSIYGFQDPAVKCDEGYATNPLTTYAKANELAEQGVLPLADDKFCVVVLRQATVYGYSPRMRFDLAINGMTYGAWKTGVLPLMRDGSQWRPMVHVRDTASAQIFMLPRRADKVNGQLFNVGSDANNYQLGPARRDRLRRPAEARRGSSGTATPTTAPTASTSPRSRRSAGRPSAPRATARARSTSKLEAGALDRTTETITLDWYQTLTKWHRIIKEVELYGGI